MLILLHGDETFLIRQKVKEFVDYYRTKDPKGVSFFRFDAEDVSMAALCEVTTSTPLFTVRAVSGARPPKKFVVVENVEKNESLRKDLLRDISARGNFYFSEESPLVLLLTVSKTLPAADSLLTLCAQEGKVSAFPTLSETQRAPLFKKMWGEEGLRADREALQYFTRCVGSDTWRAAHEIKKISAAKKGSGSIVVTIDDVRQFLAPPVELNAFALTDAFAERQRTRALEYWNTLRGQGEEPHQLLAALLWQARNLVAVRSMLDERQSLGDIIKKTKLHPFAARKSYSQAKNYSLEELKGLYEKLFWLEVNTKLGKEDITAGFEKIAVSL